MGRKADHCQRTAIIKIRCEGLAGKKGIELFAHGQMRCQHRDVVPHRLPLLWGVNPAVSSTGQTRADRSRVVVRRVCRAGRCRCKGVCPFFGRPRIRHYVLRISADALQVETRARTTDGEAVLCAFLSSGCRSAQGGPADTLRRLRLTGIGMSDNPSCHALTHSAS